jgi:mitochondrial import inner membrane translocase subunit TIM21
MNFYIQGREPGVHSDSSDSYVDVATKWIQEKSSHLSEMGYDEMVEWTKDQSTHLWDKFHRSFKYLTGAPVPPPISDPSSRLEEHKDEKSSTWQWTGLFSSLRKSRGGSPDTLPESSGKIFTDGEVHADFVRVSAVSIRRILSIANKTIFRIMTDILYADIYWSIYPVSPSQCLSILQTLMYAVLDSRARNPIRVFVDRAPGVRENEPVLRWHS